MFIILTMTQEVVSLLNLGIPFKKFHSLSLFTAKPTDLTFGWANHNTTVKDAIVTRQEQNMWLRSSWFPVSKLWYLHYLVRKLTVEIPVHLA